MGTRRGLRSGRALPRGIWATEGASTSTPPAPPVPLPAALPIYVATAQAGEPNPAERGEDAVLKRRDIDRKSTRLNSSHLGISYAVFCLKKKNRRREEAGRLTGVQARDQAVSRLQQNVDIQPRAA